MTVAPGVTAELAAWISGVRADDLPAGVRDTVARHLLDHVANVVAGAGSPAAATALRTVRAAPEGEGALAVGVGTVSPPNAAWCNGLSAHCLDLDDGYTPGGVHPGSVVTPAALAASAELDPGGDRLLAAIAAGMETACRVAAAGHPLLRERGWHSTGTAAVFGAAAGVANLMCCGPKVTASALGIAGSHAAGLMAFVGGGESVKAVHAARAARDGLLSANLAAAGVDGPGDVLESRYGYFAALAGESGLANSVLEDLGQRWAVAGSYLKPFPGCRDAHGPVEALLRLRAAHGIRPDDVERIQVTTLSRVVAHDDRDFATPLQAQLSIPYNVAVALVDGRLTLDQFTVERIADPRVRALVDRCELAGSTELDGLFPAARPSVVEVVLRDGRQVRERVDHPLGEPANPMSREQLVGKFMAQVVPALGERTATRLQRACESLDVALMMAILTNVPKVSTSTDN